MFSPETLCVWEGANANLSLLRRIEDNLVITKDGTYNLTTAPKDPEEMEKIIQQS